MLPGGLADVVENDSHSTLAGARPNLFPDIHLRVGEGFVGAKRTGAAEVFVTAGGYPRAGADLLHELERGTCHTSSDSPDENFVAGLDLGARDNHSASGQRGKRERCRGLARDIGRNSTHVTGGYNHVLGQSTRMMLAEQAKSHAERLLTGAAILAGAVADSGIDDDRIADVGGSLRVFAHCLDGAGRIGTQYPGRPQRDARQALKHEQIEAIERCSRDAHTHVPGGNFRDRQIRTILELFESPVRGDRNCSQRKPRGLYSEPERKVCAMRRKISGLPSFRSHLNATDKGPTAG